MTRRAAGAVALIVLGAVMIWVGWRGLPRLGRWLSEVAAVWLGARAARLSPLLGGGGGSSEPAPEAPEEPVPAEPAPAESIPEAVPPEVVVP